ncbi:hypothetical protein EDD11_006469 [Mortierella claussenii]|nr:hypothetical protein EDD11_006469 [Mortierella claussenii]
MSPTPLLPVSFQESLVQDRHGSKSKPAWAWLKGSVSPPIKLALALIITIVLLLTVQERNEIGFVIPDATFSGNHSGLQLQSAVVSTPRIFDIILFNGEFDLLDIRLNELHNDVDFFVIVESSITFSGMFKPLYFRENEGRFKKFRRQIIHVTIPTAELGELTNAWRVESLSRNKGFWMALDIHRPQEGDWLLLSDLDEVPRTSVLAAMKAQDPRTKLGKLFGDGTKGTGGDLFRFGCQFYYYSYEFRHIRGQWNGPVVVRYRALGSAALEHQTNEKQLKAMHDLAQDDWSRAGSMLRDFRHEEAATFVDNACFHCSWCFPNITQVVRKVEAYSHAEHNQARYKERQWILDRYSQGLDLFEREWDQFKYVKNNQDLPKYVLDNPVKYAYLVSRRGKANAGFVDVDPLNP